MSMIRRSPVRTLYRGPASFNRDIQPKVRDAMVKLKVSTASISIYSRRIPCSQIAWRCPEETMFLHSILLSQKMGRPDGTVQPIVYAKEGSCNEWLKLLLGERERGRKRKTSLTVQLVTLRKLRKLDSIPRLTLWHQRTLSCQMTFGRLLKGSVMGEHSLEKRTAKQ